MSEPYSVVFLPVPEELEPAVMKLVSALIIASSMTPWDATSMSSLLEGLDDEQRAVLLFVARMRAEERRFVSDVETAAATGLSLRATRGIIGELNSIAGDQSHNLLVMERLGPDGRDGAVRDLLISLPHAKLVFRCLAGNDRERA